MFKVHKTATDFFRDMLWILKVVASGPVKTMSHHRLLLLEQKFNLHVMLNADHEFLAQKTAPHRDFYNIRKARLAENAAWLGRSGGEGSTRWGKWFSLPSRHPGIL